jgi:NitT/TauT family transport system substrate-binding protein
MKKKYLKLTAIATFLFVFTTAFIGCKTKKDDTVTKIRLNEVTRSIFYAPMYAAINQGFFKEEGIDIELTTGQGADKTMQQLLSGNADIGFSGPEQVLYIYNQKRDDYPIVFAQLTQKDGSFLVSRKDEPNFKWESLKGKKVIGGRPGGMPQMALEYVLRNHGINVKTDMEMITNIAFGVVPAAFKGGTGEYAAIFEPTASMIVKEQGGSIHSVGEAAGTLPYTCFYATKSYIEKNPVIMEKFTRAIYKGQLWVNKNKDEDVVKAIKSFFPDTDEALMIQVVKNYKQIDAYSKTPILQKADMTRLMDIVQSYDPELLKERPPYEKVVDNKFGEKVVKEVK